jgi:hypothetical protein
MEATISTETSLNFHRATQRQMPEYTFFFPLSPASEPQIVLYLLGWSATQSTINKATIGLLYQHWIVGYDYGTIDGRNSSVRQ